MERGTLSVDTDAGYPVGWPEWIDKEDLPVKDGRDPLGLETITTDRIVPLLVPGILALSQRARYFSFHSFLLDEFARRRLLPTAENQSNYVRRREFDYAAAVLRCRNPDCRLDPRPVGVNAVRPALQRAEHDQQLPRGESVDSELGGYGLYYRTPLRILGMVAPRGTLKGGEPIPVDVLAGPRAEALAETFRQAVKDTEYYRTYFMGDQPIPFAVLDELSDAACLCELEKHEPEVNAVRRAFFEDWEGVQSADVTRRRRAVALMLRLCIDSPAASADASALREACWHELETLQRADDAWSDTVASWAALFGKEYLQEGLRGLWHAVNRLGRECCPADGFVLHDFYSLIRRRFANETDLAFGSGVLHVEKAGRTQVLLGKVERLSDGLSLEQIRFWATGHDTPASALVLLLALHSHLVLAEGFSSDSGWYEIGLQDGFRQPGLLHFAAHVRAHLEEDPTVGDTMVWLVRRYIVSPHDYIASVKLPEFTFRFRIDAGRLRFYSKPSIDFPFADSRHAALTSLSKDMGLWERTSDGYKVTAAGQRVITEAFG